MTYTIGIIPILEVRKPRSNGPTVIQWQSQKLNQSHLASKPTSPSEALTRNTGFRGGRADAVGWEGEIQQLRTQTLGQEVAPKKDPLFFRVRGGSSSSLAGLGNIPGVERWLRQGSGPYITSPILSSLLCPTNDHSTSTTGPFSKREAPDHH